jgi:hypothetical protein
LFAAVVSIKVKVKCALVDAMKAYRGSRRIPPLILYTVTSVKYRREAKTVIPVFVSSAAVAPANDKPVESAH